MLQIDTIDYLKKLINNNNRVWFNDNRTQYDSAYADVLELTTKVLEGLQKHDKTLIGLEPKKCIMRIYRDVRFSKNKDPFKTNFGIGFSKNGKATEGAGYYLHISPGTSFVGGGWWTPTSANIQKIRQEIDYNATDFLKIIQQKEFKKTMGELDDSLKLKKPPKGYTADNVMIEYLKLNSYTAGSAIADGDLTQANTIDNIVAKMGVIHPLVNFLSHATES